MQHNERMVDDFGQPYFGARSDGVRGRGDEHQAVGAVGQTFDFGAGERFGDDAEFDFAARDGHHDLRAGVLFERNADLRVGAQEVGQVVGQEAVRGVGVGPQGDVAAYAGGERGEVGVHLFEPGEDLAGVAQQRFARARGLDTARLAHEERRAERGLELQQAMAGRGRREVDAFGSARQVARFGDGDEESQVGEVVMHRSDLTNAVLVESQLSSFGGASIMAREKSVDFRFRFLRTLSRW